MGGSICPSLWIFPTTYLLVNLLFVQASVTPEFGKNLVGSKVKVWWPKDRMLVIHLHFIVLTVINNKIRTPFSFWLLLPGFMRV